MISVDFTDVDAGGIEVADGKHPALVKACDLETSDNGEYLAFKFRLTGDQPATVFDNCSLQSQALWRLRGLLTALGIETPDGPFRLNRKDLLDLPIELEIVNEEWEGRQKPRVVGYAMLDEDDFEQEPEQEPEPEPKPARRGRGRPPKTEKAEEKTTTRRRRPKQPKEEGPQVGDKVTFEDEGEVFEGKILEVDQTTVVVVTEDDEEWELKISDVELA